jgi:ZIP family zinc transporter
MSFVKDMKPNCDEAGPCFGYSEPCGLECFKHFPSIRAQPLTRPSTFCRHPDGVMSADEFDSDTAEPTTAGAGTYPSRNEIDDACHSDSGTEDLEAQHHHHVPENAFMSIGLQTSIAIAMHKLPEGFITYATNHASPSLGFSVFMALFMHNITEGFAMTLPLYLALRSRVKAIFWSSLLGGISQPLGAGIAALWFTIQGHRHGDNESPGFAVYGCMFAITAGILTSVALQLFVEGLAMCHQKELCIGCAFLGMSILAMANALTAQ